jgi:outer membrane lipoprotein-sorting protein
MPKFRQCLILVMAFASASALAAPPANTPSTSPGLAKPAAGARAVKAGAAPAAPVAASLPAMAAAQVVDRYVTASGGLAAWKAVNALEFKGKMGAGATTYEAVSKKLTLERKEREEMQLPFVLQSKRPNKQRLELTFNGQNAVQVFDGTQGFKYRPFLNRPDWQPFAADELKAAMAEPGIDGWLIDYAAKGARVESAGTEMVEGQGTYKLKVTRKDGQVRHVWIDGKSFLEVKEDGEPRMLDGRPHAVSVYMRDYRPEHGLMIPRVIETVVTGVPKTEKIAIDAVAVNPQLDDSRFTKPK